MSFWFHHLSKPLYDFKSLRLQHPAVLTLIIASLVNYFGSGMTMVAFPLQVYEVTKSQAAFTYIMFLEAVAMMLSSIFIMGIVDQVNPKKALVFSNIVNGVLTLILFALDYYHVKLGAYHYYAYIFLSAASFPIIPPSFLRLYSTMVSENKNFLNKMSSFDEVTAYVSTLFAPLLAALFMKKYPPIYLFLFDAITFFMAAAILIQCSIKYEKKEALKKGLRGTFDEIRRGFTIAIKSPYLTLIMTYTLFLIFCYSLVGSFMTFHIRGTLSSSQSLYALIMFFSGVGGLLGGLFNFSATINYNFLLLLSTMFITLGCTTFVFTHSIFVFSIGYFIVSMGASVSRINRRLICFNKGGDQDGGKLTSLHMWAALVATFIGSTLSIRLAKTWTTFEVFRLSLIPLAVALLISVVLAIRYRNN